MDNADTPGSLGFREFFWTCVGRALRSVYGVIGVVGLMLTVLGGFAETVFPNIGPVLKFVSWFAPLLVGLVFFVPALFRSAYNLYQDASRQGEAYRARIAEATTNRALKEDLGKFIQKMQRARYGLNVLNSNRDPDASAKAYQLMREVCEHVRDAMGIHYAVRVGGIIERPEIGASRDAIATTKLQDIETEVLRIVGELRG